MHNGDAKTTVSYLEEDCIVMLVISYHVYAVSMRVSLQICKQIYACTLTHMYIRDTMVLGQWNQSYCSSPSRNIYRDWGFSLLSMQIYFTEVERAYNQQLFKVISGTWYDQHWHAISSTAAYLRDLYTASYNTAVDCAMGPLPFLRNHMNQDGEGGTVENTEDSVLSKHPLALTN